MPTPVITTAVVPVKSPWYSKINWTQAVALVATVATFFGFTVPPDLQSAVLAAITAVTSIVTIVLRTWFNKTVSSAS